MNALGTIDDLLAARRELAAAAAPGGVVRVCSTGCRALGALDVCAALENEIARRGIQDRARVVRTGCHGLCAGAVTMVIDPRGIFYQTVTPEDAGEIVEQTLLGGRIVRRLCWSRHGKALPRQRDIPFYKHQHRLVLRNCGVLDPRSIEDAVAHGGYLAAARAMAKLSPDEVIAEVEASGLRGRGGAGFPTGRKWKFTRAAKGDPKYIICNADEGDPGAFMDRAVLEGDPHLVIEGMIVGAYAIGAAHGVMYVRAEYPIAIEHTERALGEARKAGLLGRNILGAGLDFDIEIRQGAGAFVCGEETALIASAEGKRGMPRPRPPFPANSGLYAKPTNINNVETWANIPRIMEMGAKAYAAIGTEGSKGTKIFALAGKINNTGLVEVPMGTTLRQLIYAIGGGIPRGRKFKAAQMGGPSGGCVPAAYLDVPLDYDSVPKIGAIMGSGGLIIMDQATCMVDIARFFTDFVQTESCGKCAPCRIGTRRMLDILNRIVAGAGRPGDVQTLVELGESIRETSLCGLGQTAPNPVLSTIRHFRDEYDAHVIEGRCPANACPAMVTTTCRSACPAHVNVPEYVGLVAAGRFAEALDLIRRRNPLASVCGRACDHPCQTFCRRGDVDEPVAIRHLKRFVTDRAADAGNPPAWRGPRHGRVAVVGSGPAGLTAAHFLATMGRDVTVFEASGTIGGVLATGIPAYRLPEAALARDIEYIRRSGVTIKPNSRVESLQALRDAGFDAIFVAVGAQASHSLGVPGEDLPGVIDSLEFLRDVRAGRITSLPGRTAVIGGGNAAIDAARTALRLGAGPVTLLYRRGRDEMPAIAEEIEEAQAEGVEMRMLLAPEAIEGDGRAAAVRCAEMELGPADESGRRRPVPRPGSHVTIEADNVIVAVGQAADLDFVGAAEASDSGPVVSRGRLQTHPVTQRSGAGNVFAGGDAVTGPSTIIEAIASGQRAAQAIDRMLGGTGSLPPDEGFAPRHRPDEQSASAPGQKVRTVPKSRRSGNFTEVLKGYSQQAARAEACRCLRCDLE